MELVSRNRLPQNLQLSLSIQAKDDRQTEMGESAEEILKALKMTMIGTIGIASDRGLFCFHL
jgi:hypothetical protein